jgi:hypothetical protein
MLSDTDSLHFRGFKASKTVTPYAYKTSGSVQVLIKVKRSGVIYHELNENFLRTVAKLPYLKAYPKAGGQSKTDQFTNE